MVERPRGVGSATTPLPPRHRRRWAFPRKELPSDEGYGWDAEDVEAEKPSLGGAVGVDAAVADDQR